MSETMAVLRAPDGLLHFPHPDEAARPACDADGRELEPRDHPVYAAGMWCTACMQTLAGPRS